jgi:hypothetical protein
MTREGYAAGTSLENGYPAEADILEYFSDRGLEIITENNPNFIVEFVQSLWGLLNAFDWAGALGVYCPSTTTFNVRGGKYLFADEVKTYTPGTAVNPTDNDTTYIWMKYDNTIGSGIDGSGWPTFEHIKLAEIDVDAAGVITDVRDLRGETFLRYHPPGGTFVLKATIANGNTVAVYNANAPCKCRILDAWSVAKSADGGTWKITDGTNDITNAVTVTSTDKTINRAGTIDDTYHEIAVGGSISVVGATGADAEVYILCMRVV